MTETECAAVWSLYLIRTAQGALYTGISTDPDRRLLEHAASARGARALRGRGPLTMIWRQAVGTRSQAQRAEAAVKRLPRVRKEQLAGGALRLEDIVGDGCLSAAAQKAGESTRK
ncbi:MAG TPA: GIY-YIG nuclease family protein [Pseudomonadales bacterium]|nr:GIY-YIG nuclease family protein [Pseudomonadales bacterium]